MQTNIPILVSGEIYISLQAKRDLKKELLKLEYSFKSYAVTHIKKIFLNEFCNRICWRQFKMEDYGCDREKKEVLKRRINAISIKMKKKIKWQNISPRSNSHNIEN